MGLKVKRIFDLLVSIVAIFSFMGVFLAIAFFVRRRIGSPVLFTQQRPGKNGVPFKMVKFRSMLDKRGGDGKLLADEERLTPFGRWLRATSLDELPELWNVLKGDMSVVGPRPLLLEYLPLYSSYHARRHEIRPGITGLAQVNGRNKLTWNDRFNLDVWYVDNLNMWLDIKIILLTLKKVLEKEGVNAIGDTTMPKFTGNLNE